MKNHKVQQESLYEDPDIAQHNLKVSFRYLFLDKSIEFFILALVVILRVMVSI